MKLYDIFVTVFGQAFFYYKVEEVKTIFLQKLEGGSCWNLF